tara:strand:+ start:28 stop:516 length:489 start_codon:yes stop_codon:yes gene_type:complete
MTIETIDNFIEDKEIFKSIKDRLFGSEMPWYYTPYVGSPTDSSGYYFLHHLYEDGKFKTPFTETILLPLLYRLPIKKLLRARINCYPKSYKIVYNQMHTDDDFFHKVALFSVNTNNGFTYFEDETKIESKENQMILFPGNIKHCSVMQRDTNLRINININYL